jgi:hypothetical protein
MATKLDKPNEQTIELLLQSLEQEKGGVQVYETALRCALNEELKEKWERYLEETRHHVQVLADVCATVGVDAEQPSPGSMIVRHLGESLVQAMRMALEDGRPEAAQLVACECVVIAETKDHLDWQLIGECAHKLLKGKDAKALKDAYDEIEDQEDEHLYHTKGWCRELWIESLGMKAVLPPPEEKKNVKSAIAAAKAEKSVEKTR